MCLIHLFKKNGTLESWRNWLLSNWSRLLNWKGPRTLLQFSKLFKRFLKIIALVYFYHVWWLNELWFKRYIQKCNLSHVLIPIMASQIWYHHGMIKNTKTWISWEQNIIFLRNKKKFNLCLQWHILWSYRFAVEVSLVF